MFKLDKKKWIFLVLLIISGLVLKYILPTNFEQLNKLGIYFIFLLLLIFFFFRKQKVIFSLKLKRKIQHKWLALLVLSTLLIYAFYSIDFPTSKTLNIYFVIYVICIAYIQSFTEELIFRGIIFNNYLLKKVSLIKAVFYSSLLFGLSHLTSLTKTNDLFAISNQIIIAVFIGFFFCALFIYFRNIYLIGLFHMLINVPAYFNRIILNSQETSNMINESSFLENLLSSVAIMIIYSPLLIVGLFLLHKAKNKQFLKVEEEMLFN